MYQDIGELGADGGRMEEQLLSFFFFLSATSLKLVLDIFSVTLLLSDLVNVSVRLKLVVSEIFIKTFLCLSVSIDFVFFSPSFPVLF